jgi:hypothetical protein
LPGKDMKTTKDGKAINKIIKVKLTFTMEINSKTTNGKKLGKGT